MGARAKKFFERAASLGGLSATIRLASLSRLSSTEAETCEDTPGVLLRLDRAMETIERELGSTAHKTAAREVLSQPRTGSATEHLLRRHVGTFLELMTQRTLFLGDEETTFRRLTEAAAATLDCARASIWLGRDHMSKIVCADLFERNQAVHGSGLELSANDYQPYFAALKEEKTIAAHDAHRDPRTSCFLAGYLKPLGITSMLDVPIWVNHEMVGVICHEHIGPPRTWNSDEERFAYLMANFAALAMEWRAPAR